jgi:hypothetical protein
MATVLLCLVVAVLLTSSASLYKLYQLQHTTTHQTTAEVRLQAVGSRVCLNKEVDGIPVQYYCERLEDESDEEFGRRSHREFVGFCAGFEETPD